MSRLKSLIRGIFRPRIAACILAAIAVGVTAWYVWDRHVGPTRIALVNFRDFQFAEMLDSEDPRAWVKLDRIDLPNLTATDLKRYDAAFFFGRGLNLDEPQQATIRRAIGAGTRVYVYGATNAASDLTDLAGDDLKRVSAYFENGGRKNLASLFRYARRRLDGKAVFAPEPDEPEVIPSDALFHLGGRFFGAVGDYQAFYESSGRFREGRPKVALLTSIFGPRNPNLGSMGALVESLEKRGLNVYPIAGFLKRLDFVREIGPDLVVYVPHGRLAPGKADEAIAYLKERGVPLLCPMTVQEEYASWLGSQKGMEGGMLSQNVVMPELDGGAEPFAVGALFPDERGLNVPGPIPDRVETFASRVEKWLTLRSKPNAEKKLAIVYYKGPGQNAMAAAALEVAPSLLNLLKRLKAEGYDLGNLPDSVEEFQARVQRQGPVLGAYAEGAFEAFLKDGDPEIIRTSDYQEWARKGVAAEAYKSVEDQYGPAPGKFLTFEHDGKRNLALPRVRFGNVVLLPQLLPAMGDDSSKLIHGAKVAPPHPYLATYLWARYGFKADALMHFGTHGSLEFTPWKQNGLSGMDWPDALVGDLPHAYLYIINNIGEAVIAKRRSYATLVSHLTPPFAESDLYGPLKELQTAIGSWQSTSDETLKAELVATITRVVREQKIDKDLKLPESSTPLDENQIEQVHDYLMTVGLEKITRGLYTLGVPYPQDRVLETARLMGVDGVAQARARLDVARGKAAREQIDDKKFFDERYHKPAFETLDALLADRADPLSFIDPADLERVKADDSAASSPGRPRPPNADADRESISAVKTLREALTTATRNRDALATSTSAELDGLVAVLNGRYIAPSSGGDAITNPDAVPTGRNLTSIDAEKTPSAEAWKVGKKLAEETIQAKLSETGKFPKKVALSMWGGEFINTQGVDLALIFHLLGVEPVRNARGEVHDVRLIAAAELKRPRVDVVVQTSGQLRDIAASRLALIDRAVKLAASADDPADFENHVREGAVAAESLMKERGLSPVEAKMFATARVFGGVNGNYGTGIMGMVEAGDRWENADEVADQYLKNMGAVYIGEHWAAYNPGVFEGALQNTDTIVHSRSSNVNGALSLDHVYEFMGGLNNAIRKVTGAEPAAYFADVRNKHNPKMQAAHEAVWVEARSTLLNPKYIRDLQAGGASSAAVFAETFRNTYAWNALKPELIDDALWDELYAVYVEDREGLGIREAFAAKNPYALQEMTAVMAETARKGLWEATPEQLRAISALHVDLVNRHKPGCSGFVCDNAKLRETIRKNAAGPAADAYLAAIDEVREDVAARSGSHKVEGLALEKVDPTKAANRAEPATVEAVKDYSRPVDVQTAREKSSVSEAVGLVLVLAAGLTVLGRLWKRSEV
ncbi:cobaltochelatase subunit CobN [Paludisphaera rhizosphaerae]|uniref:cobaltochelatase subunit CobN n=1 Tax=Paludisphaera rhizosphaerae TaxID=2711216 RepID=UPI0013EAD33A|nr:cobaltochelatase subunit CobN [Paludisphaera rhizosphaerae]